MTFLHYISARTGLMPLRSPDSQVKLRSGQRYDEKKVTLATATATATARDAAAEEEEQEAGDVTTLDTREPAYPEPVVIAQADRNDEGSNARKARPRGTMRGGPSNGLALRQYAEATLGGGSLRKAVKLPEGEDLDEWLAVNMVDFYNQINLLYGAITEFCSPESCYPMKATDEFEYLWQDNENYKKPTKMSAPDYINHLMSWVQATIDNESVLPSRIGVPFPKGFQALVRQIFKRMYRVYAHIYCHHYAVIRELGLEPHLNTSFKQYVLFVDEHNLDSGKDFYGPLYDLAKKMIESD